MSFHGLMPHFFMSLSNIPLCGCTTICVCIHLLKGILVLAIVNEVATYKHPYTGFRVDISLQLLWVIPERAITGSCKSRFSWGGNCLPKRLHHFAFPPGVNESSHCCTSSPVFGAISVLGLGHSRRCVEVSRYFTLKFPNEI